MSTKFPWYDVVVGNQLEQGDFLLNCPVLEAKWTGANEPNLAHSLEASVRLFDVVIMTQSCDLVQDKIDTVLVTPYFSVEFLVQHNWPTASPKEIANLRERIRRGEMPGYHMLAGCELPGFIHGLQIVSFYQVFSVPKNLVLYLAEQQSPRLRLLPPYREHLGQAFARFFMRIGLPLDIPPQK